MLNKYTFLTQLDSNSFLDLDQVEFFFLPYTFYNYYLDFFFYFIFLLVCLGLTTLIFVLLFSIGRLFKIQDDEKTSSYQSGFLPILNAQTNIDIQYFYIAILFLIFEVELIFFFFWALLGIAQLKILLNFFYLYVFLIFFYVLIFGFLFEFICHSLDI